MSTLLLITLGLAALGIAIGAGLGFVMRRYSQRPRLMVHLVLLATSMVPIAAHIRFTALSAASFGEPAIDPLGMLPAFQTAMVTTFVMLAVLFAVGAFVARFAPVFTAAVPPAAFVFYYLFVLPQLADLPVLVPLDDTSTAWLFAYQVFFTALLGAYAILVSRRVRRDVEHRRALQ